jgi:UDP-N-acetylglucosamine:LPS N-acetylglucosamine transferase
VSFDKPDAMSQLADEQVDWAHHPTTRNIPNLLRNVAVAWRVLRRHRPDLVVSTGAAVAIPFFALCKLFRIHAVYIEVYDRVSTRTVSGRICRRMSSRFFVQWEQQVALYPGATVIGRLL